MPALKPFVDYVDAAPAWWESNLEDYQRTPATAFLREAVHIADSINQCRRRFLRKKDGTFNKDSQDSVYRLGAAALSSMMSHFETYQRALFAGMLEASRFIVDFRLTECCQRLEKQSALNLDIARVLAYRGRRAPVGHLIAGGLGGWHNPRQVNAHFGAIFPDHSFLSNKQGDQLDILWQLRHSIVHTGGWLTDADAQKVGFLLKLADRPILLNENCVEAAARRLHGIVAAATKGIGSRFLPKVSLGPGKQRREIEALFEVDSPRKRWLKTPV